MKEMEKSEESNYLQQHDKKAAPEFVMQLYIDLLAQQADRGFVYAKIIGSSNYGFRIKSNGLYGTLPIKLMPWRYGMWKIWDHLEESLVGVVLRCTVLETTAPNLNLYFDASEHSFHEVILKKGQEIKAKIIHTRKSFVFVEYGHQFKWKYGSLIARIAKKDYPTISDWGEKSIGTELTIFYKDTTEKGQMLFLASPYSELQLTRESMLWHKHIIHPITVTIHEQGKRSYRIYGKFPALIHKRRYNGKTIPTPEQQGFLNSLEDGDVFDCRIIEITKTQSHFIVVLPNEL
jgi:hypothetical protein